MLSHPYIEEERARKRRAWMAGWMGFRPGAGARGFLCSQGRKDLVFAQDPRRHIGGAGRHGGELESPPRIFLEGDAAWGDFIDGAGDLIDRGGEVAVLHANDGLACLLDPVQDLLVFDLEFGISLCFFPYTLTIGVVLT